MFYLIVYCNTLLATLNARKVLRGGFLEDDPSISLHTHSLQQRTNHTFPGTTSRVITHPHMPNNISVKIDTTEEYVRDEVSSACKAVLFASLTRRPAALFLE